MKLLRKQFSKYLLSIESKIKIRLLPNNEISIGGTSFYYINLNYQNKRLLLVFDGVWMEPNKIDSLLLEIKEAKEIANKINQFLLKIKEKESSL